MKQTLTTFAWVVVFVLGQKWALCSFITDEERLRSQLFSSYNPAVRPYLTTSIRVSIGIKSLIVLDVTKQSMSISAGMIFVWHDTRLMWNTSEHAGLSTLVTPPEDIWTPPMVVENAQKDVKVLGGEDNDATPVRVTYGGWVTWTPPDALTTTCEMSIVQFPFDTQTCHVVLLGWTYPVSEMNLTVVGNPTTDIYDSHGEFDLLKTYYSVRNVGSNTSSTSEIFTKLNFYFTFRRKWQFYGQNVLMPVVLNSILMNAVFALPIDSGEKMSYSLTVLLSYALFLVWITNNLPPTSSGSSILQIYLSVVLCIGCLATLLTMAVLHIYKQPSSKPVHRALRKLATKFLIPFRDFTYCGCTRRNKTENQTDAANTTFRHGRNSANKVAPEIGTRLSEIDRGIQTQSSALTELKGAQLAAREDNRGDFHYKVDEYGVTSLPDRRGSESGSCNNSGRDETPTVSWQELASLFDHLFLYVFSFVLVTLTVVVLSLLYAYY